MATITTELQAIRVEPVSLDAVRSLLAPQPAPCLSLYLTTHRSVPENTVDRPTYRYLVETLERTLDEAHPRDTVERLLRPFRLLAEDHDFWEHTRDGVAILAADGRARVFLLQQPVPTLALVGRRFHTLPLVHAASSLERCHVLALTSRRAWVFEAFVWHGPAGGADADASVTLDPVTLTTPGGESPSLEIADVVDVDILEPHRVQTGMGPAGMGASGTVHGGFGSRQDEVEKDTEIFLRFVDATVLEQLSRRTTLPLVLVAAPPLAATFRGLTKNAWLLEQHVPLDPALMARDTLAAAVTPLLAASRAARVGQAVAAFGRAVVTSRPATSRRWRGPPSPVASRRSSSKWIGSRPGTWTARPARSGPPTKPCQTADAAALSSRPSRRISSAPSRRPCSRRVARWSRSCATPCRPRAAWRRWTAPDHTPSPHVCVTPRGGAHALEPA